MPADGLYPCVGMHSEGEEVRLNLDAPWEHSDVILMSIDNYEEEWARLHDIRINGQVRRTRSSGVLVFFICFVLCHVTVCIALLKLVPSV